MKKIKSVLTRLSCALISVSAVSCGDASGVSDKPVLAVSIEPQRAWLEEIVGDKYEVVAMLPRGANPENFDPGMQSRKQLERAQAYFITGYLPFEDKLVSSLGADSRVRIVNTSEGIVPVLGTHDHNHGEEAHHHHHGRHEHGNGADPHVWTSLKNARVMIGHMKDAVTDIDTANRAFYSQNFAALDARIDSLDQVYSARLGSGASNRAFAVWHPSLSYFARDYGLEQIAVGFENKEIPAVTLKKVIEEAREDSVRVFFFQKEFDSRQAETLNSAMGTEMIIITPLDYEWEKQFDAIVSALCR